MIQKFMQKVLKQASGCWEWQGKCPQKGYGRCYLLWRSHSEQQAHRTSWILHNGHIPLGMHCLHKCDNAKCVNPEHLYLGNNTDNVRDRMKRLRGGARKRMGAAHYKTNFTEADIDRIRNGTEPIAALAKEFKVTYQCIWSIRKGKNWISEPRGHG